MHNQGSDFYNKLEKQLEEKGNWPSIYMYKFIVKTDKKKMEMIKKCFEGLKANISLKKSSNHTYTSLTIKLLMSSPKEVIVKYKKISKIDGVISL